MKYKCNRSGYCIKLNYTFTCISITYSTWEFSQLAKKYLSNIFILCNTKIALLCHRIIAIMRVRFHEKYVKTNGRIVEFYRTRCKIVFIEIVVAGDRNSFDNDWSLVCFWLSFAFNRVRWCYRSLKRVRYISYRANGSLVSTYVFTFPHQDVSLSILVTAPLISVSVIGLLSARVPTFVGGGKIAGFVAWATNFTVLSAGIRNRLECLRI